MPERKQTIKITLDAFGDSRVDVVCSGTRIIREDSALVIYYGSDIVALFNWDRVVVVRSFEPDHYGE